MSCVLSEPKFAELTTTAIYALVFHVSIASLVYAIRRY